MSIIRIRTYGTTQFILMYSQVNNAFIFNRKDVGTFTETTLLECRESCEAINYFDDRINFYCEVIGIHPNQLIKG